MRQSPIVRPRGYFIAAVVAAGLAMIATATFGHSYSSLSLQKEAFDRLSYTPSFDPLEDVTLGVSPNATNAQATLPNKAIRVIKVFPTQTILVAGGKTLKIIDVAAPATMHKLIQVVNRPGWLSESGTVDTMKAAVIVEHGSKMTVGGPQTTELVMQVRPGVLLAADQATLVLTKTYIHASDTHTPNEFTSPVAVQGRPFLLAISSTMTIAGCTLRYLGRDWNSSYGASWSKGSTGSVRNSVFDHDFIGVYTNAAKNLKVLNNSFYHNSLYGVDPHSGSTHIDVENNVADDNGRHGIIFSNHVTTSIVRNNVTSGNGLNGIMMDQASTGNVIDHNTSEDNKSDGIVMASSGGNIIAANTVRRNRVGITVRGDSPNLRIAANIISANRVATQGTSGSGNRLSDNGGSFIPKRIAFIWAGGMVLFFLFAVLTWISGRSRSPRHGSDSSLRWSGGVA